MSEVHDKLLPVPQWLTMNCRAQVAPAGVKFLTPFGIMSDMWVKDGLVPIHVDEQPQGFWTYVWVLLNDMDCQLKEVESVTPLLVGTLLCFDSTRPHRTISNYSGKTSGRFAMLSWDMPKFGYQLNHFYDDIVEKRISAG